MSPIDPSTRQSIEQALLERDIPRAADLAEAALAWGQRDPMLFNLAAWKLEEAGDFHAALELLNQALTLAPGDPNIVGAIGAVLRKQGNLREALKQLDEAIRLDPTAASPWLERGMALETGGSLEAALASYQRAAQLDPASASAFGGVASIASRRGNLDVAEQFGERALEIDPLDPPGAAGFARTRIEQGRPDDALAILDRVLAADLRDENLANLASLKGDALDRLGRHGDAFAAYSTANRGTARRLESLDVGAESHHDLAERLGREFAGLDQWPGSNADSSPAPSFLIGYPRSGTTLVENVLASISGVEALEERPTLSAGDDYLQPGGLARLAKANRTKLNKLRKAYWDYVSAAGIDVGGKLFIDKDPLKGLYLPMIARLFPAAKIIVMRRDPRDVVWSCFKSNFAPTSAGAGFTGLERGARHYDALMRTQQQFLAGLRLDCHELRYEALVADFDGETQRLCGFLGTEWSVEMRDFARTARRRGVSTMSAGQVNKPLYDGSRQWQRYEEQLRPILPILQPWVERFGYSS